MINKKLLTMVTSILMLSLAFVGCAKNETSDLFEADSDISVVARDAASGTRGAFHEIMGIIQKEGDTQVDNLVVGALEFDGTDKVITAVEGDKYAIGYISVGSLSERIKAVAVNGVEPTVENVKSGEYSVSRPFLLVTKGEESDLVKDFILFTQSTNGQQIVTDMKFIGSQEAPKEYTVSGMSGTIKVAGSTSVTPVMEKLQEAYQELNPNVTFETQSNGSSQGIKAAIEGSYDIGMSSRELKEEEASQLNKHILAIDGIAVIINNENPTTSLTGEVITKIYTGEVTAWNEVK